MSDDLQTLDAMHDAAWALLEAGGGMTAGLATVSADGAPEARTVVLRHAARAQAMLEVYTDIKSDKITSLQHNPSASFLIWDPETQLQIRALTQVDILTGAATDDAWAAVPDHSRQSYGVAPPPGAEIAEPTAYHKPGGQAHFAVLRCAIKTLDIVSLKLPHRRARFSLSQDGEWAANWLAP
jgi:pyridoxine/pyridoxamine 5'-phosphate oxidase